MLRAENLTVEVFIDEDDDGTRYAEALMLRSRDRRLVAPGHARLALRNSRLARVEALLRDGDFDVIHDHSMCGPLAAPYRGAPTVVTVHGPVRGEIGDFYEALGDSIHLVAISHAQRGDRPGLPWIGTVYNAVDPTRFGPNPRSAGPVLWLA